MRYRNLIISAFILFASVTGMLLSALLVFEYYGITPSAAEAVCARGSGGVNACTVVSASRFAAIKGIPVIKEIPMAAAGFLFYGFIFLIQFFVLFRKNKDNIRYTTAVIIVLSGIALAGDVVLYLISIFVIKLVCPLCFMTYIATMIIFISSLTIYRKNSTQMEGVSFMKIRESFKSNVILFVLAVLISGAGASGIIGGARLMAAKKEAVTYEERLDNAVREYESSKTVSIVTEDVPRIGSKNAPASFTVFFDYTCNHCMYEIDFLEKLIKKYPDAVAVNFKFLPLNGVCGTLEKGRDDEWAEGCVSAAAAYAANMQNRFMEYSNLLFDSYHNKNQKLTQSVVRDLAKKAKLNMSGFDRDFTSESAKKFIKREYDESEELNINSTPTVYLNGKLLTKGLRKHDIMEGLVQYCVKRGE